MTVRLGLRAAVATTVSATALAFVAGIATSGPASADDLCYGGGVSGSSITAVQLIECIPTPLPAACAHPSTSLGTLISANVEACVPD